jgi:predicted metal-binding protein
MTSLADKPEKVRRISSYIDPVQLKMDLEQLRDKALTLGAADAAVIQIDDVIFDPELLKRVNADGGYPSVHWPLNYPKDDLKEAIKAYQWAIFFRMKIDGDFPYYGGGPILNGEHRQWYLKLYEITAALESSGFYMGYQLSLGLASGNCRGVFCADEKRCWPMIKGRACIRPNMGRPSMEATGIDALSIADKLNWHLPEGGSYPILAGLVMIT